MRCPAPGFDDAYAERLSLDKTKKYPVYGRTHGIFEGSAAAYRGPENPDGLKVLDQTRKLEPCANFDALERLLPFESSAFVNIPDYEWAVYSPEIVRKYPGQGAL